MKFCRSVCTNSLWSVESVTLCDGCGESIPQQIEYEEDREFQVSSWNHGEVDVCKTCFTTKVIPALSAVGLTMHSGMAIDLTPPVPPPTPPTEEQRSVLSILDKLVVNPRRRGT